MNAALKLSNLAINNAVFLIREQFAEAGKLRPDTFDGLAGEVGVYAIDHPADFVGAMHVEIERDPAALVFAVHQFVQVLAVINEQKLFDLLAACRQDACALFFALEVRGSSPRSHLPEKSCGRFPAALPARFAAP